MKKILGALLIVPALAFGATLALGHSAILFWQRTPPEPVYDSSVRVRPSVAPQVIVAVLGLAWLAAQAPAVVARFF